MKKSKENWAFSLIISLVNAKESVYKQSLYLLFAFNSIFFIPFSFQVSAQDLNMEIKHQLFPGSKQKDVKYSFASIYVEHTISLSDHTKLHGVLFPSKSSKGLIFYLHGSNDDVSTWGMISNIYTQHNYDLFIIDYRGYGKSEGEFQTEEQWYQDLQEVYDYLKKSYKEENIIILGQSLGTAAASFLGAKNNPKLVILQAPFYNMVDWILSLGIKDDLNDLKFEFANNQRIKQIKAPIYIFHGDDDKAVSLKSSLKLRKLFKKIDRLYILKNEGHNDFTKNKDYLIQLSEILRN